MAAQFVRLAEAQRRPVNLYIDGRPMMALEGDSVLVALLTNVGHLRESEFGDGPRAGFCLMATCQDCWVWTASGERLRACSTPVAAGMRILTRQLEEVWPGLE